MGDSVKTALLSPTVVFHVQQGQAAHSWAGFSQLGSLLTAGQAAHSWVGSVGEGSMPSHSFLGWDISRLDLVRVWVVITDALTVTAMAVLCLEDGVLEERHSGKSYLMLLISYSSDWPQWLPRPLSILENKTL